MEKEIMILYFWLGQWWTWCKGISIQSTGQERNFLWMKVHVLLRAGSISSVITKKKTRFHIKLFMVNGPSTGYLWGFEVYTGDASGQSQGNVQELQNASKTSGIVLGLLDSVQLLNVGHHIYFDNYYNSPDLIDLLHRRKTHACGTVRKNLKSLTLVVTQAKLKRRWDCLPP